MQAPGGPGAPPSWGPGRKHAFGTAATPRSRVWFTLAGGALSEVFHPALDRPLLHELRFLVAASGTPPIDVAREARHEVRWIEAGVPSFDATSAHPEFQLTTQYVTDPDRDSLLIAGDFQPELPDLRLFLHAALHLVPGAAGNDAQVLDLDPPVLLGRQGPTWLALLGPFAKASVGFLNASDTYVDLHDNDGDMLWSHDRAFNGNATLGAQIALRGGAFQLALGFGRTAEEAEENARESRQRGFAALRDEFTTQWRRRLDLPRPFAQVSGDGGALARASAAVLLSLEDKQRPGAFVAAPCAPWGERCRDGEHVYHLVWPRDLCQIATALLHTGEPAAAQRALRYLEAIQLAHGGWPQNCTIDGKPHWDGSELDETAAPILLAWALQAAGQLDHDPWPLAKRAALHLLTEGPLTQLDRWEDAGGLSPSTLAVCIAALLVAADLAEATPDAASAGHLRSVADYWNDRVEAWCCRPDGAYARLGPGPDQRPSPGAAVGVEVLELVRRGLRRPDDPRVGAGLARADADLSADTPRGRTWRRYAGDRYGEPDSGEPWNGEGRGRPWPLLAGERAQRELAAGAKVVDAVSTFEAFAGPELLLPEQVWDGPPDPLHDLTPGGPTGSARPLGWAHAEYLKLLSAVARAAEPDLVEPAARRYRTATAPAHPPLIWHHRHQIGTFPAGRQVHVQLPEPATLRWSADGWATYHESPTTPAGLGLHVARLPTDIMRPGAAMEWTPHYAQRWEGRNYTLTCSAEG